MSPETSTGWHSITPHVTKGGKVGPGAETATASWLGAAFGVLTAAKDESIALAPWLAGTSVRLDKCKESLYLHVALHCRSVILSPRAAMKKKRTPKILTSCAFVLVSSLIVTTAGLMARAAKAPAQSHVSGQEQQDWPDYGGAPENNHYSKLAQINRSNVKRLAVAWSFDTLEQGRNRTAGSLTGPTARTSAFWLE